MLNLCVRPPARLNPRFCVLRRGSDIFGSQLRAYADASTIRAVLDRMQALCLVSRLASGLYVRPLKDERGEECLAAAEAILEAVRCADRCSLWPRAAATAGAAAAATPSRGARPANHASSIGPTLLGEPRPRCSRTRSTVGRWRCANSASTAPSISSCWTPLERAACMTGRREP
jgi:hypothetical protein